MDPSVFQRYDYDGDVTPPKVVHEHLKAHDARMRKGREDLALAKAAYTTSYWEHVREGKDKDATTIEIEVNRIHGAVGAYLAALYPRANRVVLAADPAGRGDPVKAQLAQNRWLTGRRIHQRIMSALRQALLFPGCGAKVGFHPGRGNPLDRVWLRIVPYWEMLLDQDVTDAEDERFRGHVYHQSKIEVEREYGLTGLKGGARKDFLAESGALPEADRPKDDQGRAPEDYKAFVRLMEVCNLKDTFRDPTTGNEYLGRMEVYVLGQGELSKCPVWMGPLPFTMTDGSPLAHIEPLIFNCEPEFPNRGISGVKKLMPQQREINVYRTLLAASSRKDTRQYVYRKGSVGADAATKLTAGVDGLMIEVAEDYGGSLADIVHLVPTGPVSGNIIQYMALAEQDFDRALGASPNARGQITKATAFEVQTTQMYTESEFGLHGAIKDEWLSKVVRLANRAIIGAMQNTGDSAGAYAGTKVDLAPVGARPDELGGASVGAQATAAATAEVTAGPAPMVDEGMSGGGVEVGATSAVIEQQVLVLQERNERLAVTVADLDADFEISFVEGSRTPLTDAAMQQNLVALLPSYVQMAKAAGIPDAVLATAWLKAAADQFNLPKDLHPEEMLAAAQKVEKPKPKKGGDAGPLLQRIAKLPPPEALEALGTLVEGNAELSAAVQEAMGLPPEEQARAVAAILQAVGSAGADPSMAAMEAG